LNRFATCLKIRQNNFDISAKFPQNLTAGSAWRREMAAIGGDGHAPEFARAFGDGFEHRNTLSAYRQSVRRVFDVAAGMDATRGILKRRAYTKSGKRRVRIFPRGERGPD
jgi:hypothetical protein